MDRNHSSEVCAAGRRYASDLTDAEWRLIEPYMPAVKRLGHPRPRFLLVPAVSVALRPAALDRALGDADEINRIDISQEIRS